jgi:hypothetical protein
VRDLIYTGRLPSVRVGRLHYIKATDLDLERRRRLGSPLPLRPASAPRRTNRRTRLERLPRGAGASPVDAVVRRERAAERAALVGRWAHQHGLASPRVPAAVQRVAAPTACEVCGRQVRSGRMLEVAFADNGQLADRLCLSCGRRALLDWADRRRREAAEARRMAHSLGEPTVTPAHAAPRAA